MIPEWASKAGRAETAAGIVQIRQIFESLLERQPNSTRAIETQDPCTRVPATSKSQRQVRAATRQAAQRRWSCVLRWNRRPLKTDFYPIAVPSAGAQTNSTLNECIKYYSFIWTELQKFSAVRARTPNYSNLNGAVIVVAFFETGLTPTTPHSPLALQSFTHYRLDCTHGQQFQTSGWV